MAVVDISGTAYALALEESLLDVSNEDYLPVLQSLLPYGPAWTRRPEAWLTKVLQGLAREPSRVEMAAGAIIEETDYRTTQELLTEWEAFAGLPDCASTSGELSDRQAALHAKLTQNISPTPATFQAIAENQGYTGVVVSRNEARPLRVGFRVGDHVRGGDWHFTWSITTDQSTSQDSLLQCLVSQLAPEHGQVVYYLGTDPI